jgi:hypothetical protein
MYLKDGTGMVKVSVEIKGDIKTCLLPVLDAKNKAIENPNSFSVNTAIMRCLAKCIAIHGLGLYIYAGEDLPEAEREELDAEIDAKLAVATSVDALTILFKSLPEATRQNYIDKFAARKKELA